MDINTSNKGKQSGRTLIDALAGSDRERRCARRVSLAVDRVIAGRSPERAQRWVIAWATAAGVLV